MNMYRKMRSSSYNPKTLKQHNKMIINTSWYACYAFYFWNTKDWMLMFSKVLKYDTSFFPIFHLNFSYSDCLCTMLSNLCVLRHHDVAFALSINNVSSNFAEPPSYIRNGKIRTVYTVWKGFFEFIFRQWFTAIE